MVCSLLSKYLQSSGGGDHLTIVVQTDRATGQHISMKIQMRKRLFPALGHLETEETVILAGVNVSKCIQVGSIYKEIILCGAGGVGPWGDSSGN